MKELMVIDRSEAHFPPTRNLILVIAKDITQAKLLWRDIKHKYEHLGKVKFVSDRPRMLDGLNHEGMTIIRAGEYWLNKSNDCDVIKRLERLGATSIYEDESMIMGVDLARGKDMTVVGGLISE